MGIGNGTGYGVGVVKVATGAGIKNGTGTGTKIFFLSASVSSERENNQPHQQTVKSFEASYQKNKKLSKQNTILIESSPVWFCFGTRIGVHDVAFVIMIGLHMRDLFRYSFTGNLVGNLVKLFLPATYAYINICQQISLLSNR